MLPSKINYLHQRALRGGQKWTKRCHSPIRAWKIFFSFLLGIRKWDLQGHFFNSLGHIKSCPHCLWTGILFFLLWQKKILSHPIIGLDNWRPMAIFFYCSRKNNSSQMTKVLQNMQFLVKKIWWYQDFLFLSCLGKNLQL